MSLDRTAPKRLAGALGALAMLLLALVACDTQSAPSPSVAATSPSAAAGVCTPQEVAEGGISGRVVDEAGEPLGDILVTLETSDFYGDVRTAEDGVFNAPGVSGEFLISTTDIDYEEASRRVTVPCGELVEVELVLTPIGG